MLLFTNFITIVSVLFILKLFNDIRWENILSLKIFIIILVVIFIKNCYIKSTHGNRNYYASIKLFYAIAT